jgi:hypothetical protein
MEESPRFLQTKDDWDDRKTRSVMAPLELLCNCSDNNLNIGVRDNTSGSNFILHWEVLIRYAEIHEALHTICLEMHVFQNLG